MNFKMGLSVSVCLDDLHLMLLMWLNLGPSFYFSICPVFCSCLPPFPAFLKDIIKYLLIFHFFSLNKMFSLHFFPGGSKYYNIHTFIVKENTEAYGRISPFALSPFTALSWTLQLHVLMTSLHHIILFAFNLHIYIHVKQLKGEEYFIILEIHHLSCSHYSGSSNVCWPRNVPLAAGVLVSDSLCFRWECILPSLPTEILDAIKFWIDSIFLSFPTLL